MAERPLSPSPAVSAALRKSMSVELEKIMQQKLKQPTAPLVESPKRNEDQGSGMCADVCSRWKRVTRAELVWEKAVSFLFSIYDARAHEHQHQPTHVTLFVTTPFTPHIHSPLCAHAQERVVPIHIIPSHTSSHLTRHSPHVPKDLPVRHVMLSLCHSLISLTRTHHPNYRCSACAGQESNAWTCR